MAQKIDPIDEAILIHQRLIHMDSPGLLARLVELRPQVELALERELDPERFAQGALSLMRPLTDAGDFVGFERLLSAALTQPTTSNTHAWLRVRLAEMALGDGNSDAATSHLHQLPTPRQDEPHLELAIFYTSTMCARARGDYEEAIALNQRGIALARKLQAHKAYILLHNTLGGIYIRTNQQRQAVEAFELALHHSKKHDISLFINYIENNLATASLIEGNYQLAIEYLERLYTRFEEEDKPENLAVTASNLATAYAATGQWALAQATAQRAQALFTQGYWRGGCALSWLVLGMHALEEDHPQTAQQHLTTALAASIDEQRPDLQALAMLLLAILTSQPPPKTTISTGHMVRQDHWSALQEALQDPTRHQPELPHTNAIEALCWRLVRPQRAPSLWFNARWDFSLDGQRWISLGRRAAARTILEALTLAHPAPVQAWTLFELAWPKDQITTAQAINKLYTTIHRLRALGLEEHLITVGDGYALRGHLILPNQV